MVEWQKLKLSTIFTHIYTSQQVPSFRFNFLNNKVYNIEHSKSKLINERVACVWYAPAV